MTSRTNVSARRALPRRGSLTIDQILAWAESHRERTGSWPHPGSGRVYLAPFETWRGLDKAPREGHRGLPGGSPLARLLVEHRGVRSSCALPRLTVHQILAWADAFHQRTGKWPQVRSGILPVPRRNATQERLAYAITAGAIAETFTRSWLAKPTRSTICYIVSPRGQQIGCHEPQDAALLVLG